MKKLIYIALILISIGSCKNEPKVVEKATVVSINDSEIKLSDGQNISITPTQEGSSSIFVIRPGDYQRAEPNRVLAGLNSYGIEYTKKLESLFANKKIDHIICIGAVYANQTVQPIAEQNGLKIMHYSNSDYASALDFIFNIKKGENFILVESYKKIGDLLYTLSGNNAYTPMVVNEFDHLYLIQGPQRTQVTVQKLNI